MAVVTKISEQIGTVAEEVKSLIIITSGRKDNTSCGKLLLSVDTQ